MSQKVILTADLIQSRTGTSDLGSIKSLTLWGQRLGDVSIVRFLTQVETLALTMNNISSLKPFMHCKNLKELYLRRNAIENLEDVRYLANLENLEELWLGDNPCAAKESYRLYVLHYLPQLKKLDMEEVTDEERILARNFDPGDKEEEVVAEETVEPRVAKLGFGAPNAAEKVLYAAIALVDSLDVKGIEVVLKHCQGKLRDRK
ncbi:hypothetical protein PCE1_004156 [Barthelona sp. PCE]